MLTERLIASVLEAHAALASESDLSPANPRINAVLSALVRGVMEGAAVDAAAVLGHPEVRSLRPALLRRLALAEGALERWWSQRLQAQGCLGAGDLAGFPYWDCYRQLVAAELRHLPPGLALRPGESIAFVGAGPLPLTAVLMQLLAGMRVTCIDVDPEACGLARALISRIGLAGIDVLCIDGTRHDYARHPLVLVASLVPEKAQTLRRVRATRPQALVALRSAEGLCMLLYEPVDEAEIAALGCGLIARTGHDPRIINTTLLYRAGAEQELAADATPRIAAAVRMPGLPLLRLGARRLRAAARSLPPPASPRCGSPGPPQLGAAGAGGATRPGARRKGRARWQRSAGASVATSPGA